MAGEPADQKMSFLEHLGELRKRILWTLFSIMGGLAIALNFTDRLMKVALIAGIVLAMPMVLYQIWAFVAPGLHAHERRYAAPFVIAGSLFFLIGATFAQLVVIPFAMR